VDQLIGSRPRLAATIERQTVFWFESDRLAALTRPWTFPSTLRIQARSICYGFAATLAGVKRR
jgi:hypothetical protein